MEIAVFQGIGGKTQSFLEPGIIKVYSRNLGEWKTTKEIIFRIENKANLKEVRENISKMAEALGGCRVFVAREVKGLPYTVLDGMGFNTWELDGSAKEFLDYVFEKEEEEVKIENQVSLIQEVKDGVYLLNLKKIQENNINLTSKGILIPFLSTTTFYELQIICSHIPPWFEAEFKRLDLKAVSQTISSKEIKVTVSPIVCEE